MVSFSVVDLRPVDDVLNLVERVRDFDRTQQLLGVALSPEWEAR